MSKINEVQAQYNLDSLREDVYTGERRMILELLENNYPNWIHQPESNSVAYEIKDYILKAEVQDVLINLEDYGVTATLEQLIEVLKNR
tara:strand:+ start:617 stop:880 length:264 start_codon:yes stop_codon:yes gene_type:complete